MRICLLAIITAIAACGDDGGPIGGNQQELITRVTLTFASRSGPDVVRAKFDDPDGDGGEAPTVDPIMLSGATTYDLTIGFQNALEDPPEEITDEVADESDEHQIFLTGSAANGAASNRPGAPISYTYADMDRNGLPIGLAFQVDATPGSGKLAVTLQHMPPVNGVPVKTAETAMTIRDEGLATAPGEKDADVTFDVMVP